METPHDTIESIRRRIEHEDNLINQRLSWLVSSQAFLLTAYAILLNAPRDMRTELYIAHHELLIRLIPWTAVSCTLLLWLTIAGALMAMQDLRTNAEHISKLEARWVQGKELTRNLGLVAPVLIPGVFLLTWLAILLKR